jgi:hypothetical protein
MSGAFWCAPGNKILSELPHVRQEVWSIVFLAIFDAASEDSSILLVRVLLQAIAEVAEVEVGNVRKLVVPHSDQVGSFVVGHIRALEGCSIDGIPILSIFVNAFLDCGRALDRASVAKICGNYSSVRVDTVTDRCGTPPAGVKS